MIPTSPNSRRLHDDEIQAITEIAGRLEKSYPLDYDGEFEFASGDFDAFRLYQVNCFGPVICLNKASKPFHLSFINVTYSAAGSHYFSGYYEEYQAWGIITLQKDYGHVLLRPETWGDKIRDMLCHVDVHFEDDPDFSRRIFVISNDKNKALLTIDESMRNYIKGLELQDFVIEILGHTLIIGNNKRITVDRVTVGLEPCVQMADFLAKLSRLYSPPGTSFGLLRIDLPDTIPPLEDVK